MKVVRFLDMMMDTTTQKKTSEDLTTESGRSLKIYNIGSIPTDMPTIYQDEPPQIQNSKDTTKRVDSFGKKIAHARGFFNV